MLILEQFVMAEMCTSLHVSYLVDMVSCKYQRDMTHMIWGPSKPSYTQLLFYLKSEQKWFWYTTEPVDTANGGDCCLLAARLVLGIPPRVSYYILNHDCKDKVAWWPKDIHLWFGDWQHLAQGKVVHPLTSIKHPPLVMAGSQVLRI